MHSLYSLKRTNLKIKNLVILEMNFIVLLCRMKELLRRMENKFTSNKILLLIKTKQILKKGRKTRKQKMNDSGM